MNAFKRPNLGHAKLLGQINRHDIGVLLLGNVSCGCSMEIASRDLINSPMGHCDLIIDDNVSGKWFDLDLEVLSRGGLVNLLSV